MIQRTLHPLLEEGLKRLGKIVLLSGPRQVGKTTLAENCRTRFTQSVYFNWDNLRDQKRLLHNPYFFEEENRDPSSPFLVIFDEIHKYSRLKNYLKGAYDSFGKEFRFLVTGSGRLDLFQKGADSLLGRCLAIQLFPLTVSELCGACPSYAQFLSAVDEMPAASAAARRHYEQLFDMSGFPEPFIRGEKNFYHRWLEQRKNLLVRQDIRDASRIREISQLELLSHMIPDRVGSPLSLNSLREDVGVAFETVRDWVALLERFYYLFRITPFSKNVARAITKEPKVYLYDWGELENTAARFENIVALHLVKAVRTWAMTGEKSIAAHYLRNKEKHETDFVLVDRGKPVCLVECKSSDENLSAALCAFQRELSVPVAVQVVHKPGVCRKTRRDGFTQWVVSADRFLSLLP